MLDAVLAFALGVSVTLIVLAYAAGEPPTPRFTDLRFTAPEGPARTVDHLAAKVAPVLQQKLVEAKPDIVEAAGGPVARTAVRLGYPIAVREVPTFTDHGIRAVLSEFGHYSVADLIELLDNAAQTGDAEPSSQRLHAELIGLKGMAR